MRIWEDVSGDKAGLTGGTLTIGNFDGVHLGHQELFRQAQAFPGPHVVMTFDPHPVQVLYPERRLKKLFPIQDLHEQLPRFGVDLLVVLRFDRAFSELSPEAFCERYIKPFQPSRIVAGYDFGFGKDRQGTLDFLKEWAQRQGAELIVVSPITRDEKIISSRSIRAAVEAGNMEQVAQWLGRPFYLRGKVIHGAGRGKKSLETPTLNITPVNEILPAHGVYAGWVKIEGKKYPAVANIGTNPTFEKGDQVKVEAHLLEGGRDLYGAQVDLEFISRLRPEMTFPSAEDLKKQIQKDILKARTLLGCQ